MSGINEKQNEERLVVVVISSGGGCDESKRNARKRNGAVTHCCSENATVISFNTDFLHVTFKNMWILSVEQCCYGEMMSPTTMKLK
jgi:hypothetical protein